MSQAWGRVKLYGGKLAENFAQATAADFMAHGAITAERRGMPPFMLVHDQGISLRTKGQSADEYSAALADLPPWAKGFPMKVESEVAPYFKK
jgi:DNA polymerase